MVLIQPNRAAAMPADSPGPADAGDGEVLTRILPVQDRWAGAARIGMLALSDALALLLSGTAAFLLWASPVHGQSASLYLPATPLVLLLVLAYGQAGLYPGFAVGPVETLRRYWLVTAAAYLMLAALVFVLKLDNIYSRLTLALALTCSLLLVPLLRRMTLRLARRWAWWPEPVAVIGVSSRLTNELFDHAGAEFRPVAVTHGGKTGASSEDRSEPDAEITALARAGVRTAVADIDSVDAEAALDQVLLVFPRVIVLRDFHGLPTEGLQVRNLGGVLGLEYASNLLRARSRWVKRTLDVSLGTVLLILTSPLVLGCMIAVKLLSRGSALFWQTREGRHGRPIQVPKIRTMVPDAARQMEELFLADPALREEWHSGFKLTRDPRVIPVVGRLFRRFSMDELPQLWSVIKGDMSLVGPRPFPEYHLAALSPHARRLRSEVRPGITGLWQVTARGMAGVEAQQAHDTYYIRNWSLWLDLYILVRTLSAVISGRGAY